MPISPLQLGFFARMLRRKPAGPGEVRQGSGNAALGHEVTPQTREKISASRKLGRVAAVGAGAYLGGRVASVAVRPAVAFGGLRVADQAFGKIATGVGHPGRTAALAIGGGLAAWGAGAYAGGRFVNRRFNRWFPKKPRPAGM